MATPLISAGWPAWLRCLPPILLPNHVSYHADLFRGAQLRPRILDEVQLRLRLAVDHDVQPVVLAEPPGLDPLVRRQGDTPKRGTAFDLDVPISLTAQEGGQVPAAVLLLDGNRLAALADL